MFVPYSVTVTGDEKDFEKKMKTLAKKINELQSSSDWKVTLKYNPIFDIGGLAGNLAGFSLTQKNFAKDKDCYIVTSGHVWLALPFNPCNDWKELDDWFGEIQVIPPEAFEAPPDKDGKKWWNPFD